MVFVADFFLNSIENLLAQYTTYRSGDREHPGDASGDNGCDCRCHSRHQCCCNDCYWEYGQPDRCLPGREYCEDCREEHDDDEDPHT